MNPDFSYDMGGYIAELLCVFSNLTLIQEAMAEDVIPMKTAAEAIYAIERHIERLAADMENLNERIIRKT